MATNLDCHPLFPAKDEDTEPAEVMTIQVYRREGVKMILIPRRFMAEELTDENQIFQLYGGGIYELHARNANHITAKRGIELAGPSKPLYDAPAPPEPSQAQQQSNLAAGLNLSGAPPWWVPLAGILAPVAVQLISNSAEDRRRSQEQHAALMNTMMTNSQQANLQMITLLTNLKSNAPNGQEFKEGMAFMENVLAAQIEKMKGSGADESDDMKETLGQMMQAMQLAQMFGGNGNNGSNNGQQNP